MNIHFTDIKLKNNLDELTIDKFRIGSHMYGLDNKDSDTDYLSIYIDNNRSFMWEHHQLQFKDDLIDENYSALDSFIRNAITGDATINFEILFSDDLKNSSLSWLYEFRNDFINYNIIKSYLGMAKRDLKYLNKDTNHLKKHTKETNKKLSHFVRGVIFAKNILENNFSLDLTKTKTFDYENDLWLLKDLKEGAIDYNRIFYIVNFFEELMNKTRDELNIRHDNKTIDKFMNIDKIKELDTKVKEISDIGFIDIDYGDLFYKTLETGVSY